MLPSCRQNLLDAMEADMTFAQLRAICDKLRREKLAVALDERKRKVGEAKNDPEIQRLYKELNNSLEELIRCYQEAKRMIKKKYWRPE